MDCLLFTKPLAGEPIERVGEIAKEMGFDGVDLLIRDGAHVTPANASKTLKLAVKTLRDLDLTVPSVTTDVASADDPHAMEVFEACHEANCRLVRLGSWRYEFPGYWFTVDETRRKLEGLQDLAEKYHVRATVQVHAGALMNANCAMTYMLVQDCDKRLIGIYADPGHMALDGEDYRMGLELVSEYLCYVGVKSPRYRVTEQGCYEVEWVALSEGMVRWDEVMEALAELAYQGPLCFHCAYPADPLDAWVERSKADLGLLKPMMWSDEDDMADEQPDAEQSAPEAVEGAAAGGSAEPAS